MKKICILILLVFILVSSLPGFASDLKVLDMNGILNLENEGEDMVYGKIFK